MAMCGKKCECLGVGFGGRAIGLAVTGAHVVFTLLEMV